MADDNLVTWLRAQLDEDERRAERVTAHDQRWEFLPPRAHEYARRFGPKRALDDVEAKRRIIDLVLDDKDGVACANRLVEGEYDDDMQLPERLLKLLALPFAGRPGWREEWRP